MNKYKAFGLTIETEAILEELMPYEGEAEILIKEETIPVVMGCWTIDTLQVKIGRDKYYMEIDGLGKFYVEKGNTIIYEKKENAPFEEIKLYLYGSCMGALLYQRKILPLHGSCVNIGGNGIILTGESGAGKSTLSADICKRGFTMLTDDVSAIKRNEHEPPMVYPGCPFQKLWEDAIERIGIESKREALRVSNHVYKYRVENTGQFEDRPIGLKVLIELIPADVLCVTVTQVQGAEKLNVVLRNTYRRLIAEAMDLRKWHFEQCVMMAKEVEVYRIIRPRAIHVEEEITNIILEIIK